MKVFSQLLVLGPPRMLTIIKRAGKLRSRCSSSTGCALSRHNDELSWGYVMLPAALRLRRNTRLLLLPHDSSTPNCTAMPMNRDALYTHRKVMIRPLHIPFHTFDIQNPIVTI